MDLNKVNQEESNLEKHFIVICYNQTIQFFLYFSAIMVSLSLRIIIWCILSLVKHKLYLFSSCFLAMAVFSDVYSLVYFFFLIRI